MFDPTKLMNDTFSVLASYSKENSCIFATKVFIGISRRLNLGECVPLTVMAGILSPDEAKKYKSGTLSTVNFPTEQEMGKLTNQKDWCGHLVAIIKNANPVSNNKHALFDITIPQLDKKLSSKDFYVDEVFISYGSRTGILNNNIYVAYKSYPNVKIFTQFDEWSNPLQNEVIEHILSKQSLS